MATVTGYGAIRAIDVLADCSFQLIQPVVNTTITAITAAGFGSLPYGVGGFGAGSGYSVTLGSLAGVYVGAQVVFGYGAADEEVATVLAIAAGTVTVGLVNTHSVGEKVYAPTFPVQQTVDPLYTQDEMIGYLSTAANDFLTRVPVAYAIDDSFTVAATVQNAALPADCIVPERIAVKTSSGYVAMREESQASLDGYDYRWQEQMAAQPRAYFRDKVPYQNVGIWPRANNTVDGEIVYSQRQAETMGILDGFFIPDPFLTYVKFKTLAYAYSKEGGMENPALAKYFASRYEMGIKVAEMVTGVFNAADVNG